MGLPHFNAYIDWCYVMQCPVLFDSSKNKGFWSARLENQSCMKSLSISPPLIAALFRWAVFKTPVGWWSWWFLGIILGIIIQSGNVKNVFTVQVPWAAGDTATFAPAGGPPARSRPSRPSCACGGRAAPALRAASVPRAAHAGAALGSLTGTGGTDAQWPGAVEVYGDFRGKSMEFSWDIYGYLWDFHGFSGIFVGKLWDFLGFSWKTYEIFWHSKFVKWGFRKIFESVPLDFSFLLVSHHFPRYFLLIFPCFSGFWTWTFTRRSWLAMAAIVLPKALCQAWQENHDFLWGCGCRSPEKCGISHVLVESRGGRSSRKWARNHLDSGKNPSRCVLIWGFNLGLHPNCYLNGGQSGGPIWF